MRGIREAIAAGGYARFAEEARAGYASGDLAALA